MIGLPSDYVLSDELKESIKRYGLGTERSLQDYYNYTGLDIVNKKMTKNLCNMQDDIIEGFGFSVSSFRSTRSLIIFTGFIIGFFGFIIAMLSKKTKKSFRKLRLSKK